MINGAHVVISSTNADAEIAVHPAETRGKHELFFMCESVDVGGYEPQHQRPQSA